MVAASPSSRVSIAVPTTSASKCFDASSFKSTISTVPAVTKSAKWSLVVHRERPLSNSRATALTTRIGADSTRATSRTAPEATRLITALASATMPRSDSIRSRDGIVDLRIAVIGVQDAPQFQTIEMQKTRELTLAQQTTAGGFRGQQVQPQSRRPVGLDFGIVRERLIPED